MDESFAYPFVEGQMMRTRMLFEQGIVTSMSDWTGISKLFRLEDKQRYFKISTEEKTYFPSSSTDYDSKLAFEIAIELSTVAMSVEQEVYMLTSFLVDIGGISRAFYAAGLIVSHFAAI